MTDKQPPTGMQVERQLEQILAERIPAGWSLQARRIEALGRYRARPAGGDRVTRGRERGPCRRGQANSRAARRCPGSRAALDDDGRRVAARRTRRGVRLSLPRTRALLRARGVGYVDITGNARIEISAPGLFVSTDGAGRDPWPRDHKLRSLRGRGAARAMRAIIDTHPPYGVRQLAQSTGSSAPTLSRVLGLLEREAIVTRVRGAVSTVDWQAAIRRWAEDYDQTGPPTHQRRFSSRAVCRPSSTRSARRSSPTQRPAPSQLSDSTPSHPQGWRPSTSPTRAKPSTTWISGRRRPVPTSCFWNLWILSSSIGRSPATVFAASPPANSRSTC